MGLISSKTPDKAEICNLGSEIVVQKNIAAFDISMDDSYFGTFMKICKPLCSSKNDIKPLLPV